MANKFVGTGKMQKGGGVSPKGTREGTDRGRSMSEKPGFPDLGLPGKSGPDRSAGVKKIRQYPKSMGL